MTARLCVGFRICNWQCMIAVQSEMDIPYTYNGYPLNFLFHFDLNEGTLFNHNFAGLTHIPFLFFVAGLACWFLPWKTWDWRFQ